MTGRQVFPTVRWEAAFGYGALDTVPSSGWTNISSYVQPEHDTRRGAQHELATVEVGTGSLRLRNVNGEFDRSNTSSPFWPNLRPYVPVRAIAVLPAALGGTSHPYWHGFIEGFPQAWEKHGRYGISRVKLVDGIQPLAFYTFGLTYDAELQLHPLAAYYLGALTGTSQHTSGDTLDSLVTAPDLALAGGGSFNVDDGTGGFGFTSWVKGSERPGLSFDAAQTSLAVGPFTAPFLEGAFGVTCLARLPGYTAQPDGQAVPILELASKNGANPYITLCRFGVLQNGANAEVFAEYATVANDTTGVQTLTTISTVVDPSLVHVLAFTYQVGVGGKFYVDGAMVGSGASRASTNRTLAAIGVHSNLGSSTRTVTAREIAIKDIAVTHGTSGVLTAARITELYDIARITRRELNTDALAQQLEQIFEVVAPNATYDIDPNSAMVAAATGSIFERTGLDLFNETVGLDLGVIFALPDGSYRTRQRSYAYGSTPRFTFGEGLGELPYLGDLAIDDDVDFIFNDITVSSTATTAPAERRVDETSKRRYFRRRKTWSGRYSGDEGLIADALLARYAEPRQRVPSLTLQPSSNPALWAACLQVEQGDWVRINRRPQPGRLITVDCIVERVEQRRSGSTHRTVLGLAPKP